MVTKELARNFESDLYNVQTVHLKDCKKETSIQALVTSEMSVACREVIKEINNFDSRFYKAASDFASVSASIFTVAVTSFNAKDDFHLDHVLKKCRMWYQPSAPWKLPTTDHSKVLLSEKRVEKLEMVIKCKKNLSELIFQSNQFFELLTQVQNCETLTQFNYLKGIDFPGNQTILVSQIGGNIIVDTLDVSIDFGSQLTSDDVVTQELRIESRTEGQQRVDMTFDGPREIFKYLPSRAFNLFPPGTIMQFIMALREEGNFSGTLSLNVGDMKVKVNLIGSVEKLNVSVEPKEVDFGIVCRGSQPQPQFVTIRNNTGVTMRVNSITDTKSSVDEILWPHSRVTVKTLPPAEMLSESELVVTAGVSANIGGFVSFTIPIKVMYADPKVEISSVRSGIISNGDVLQPVELESEEVWQQVFTVRNMGPVAFKVKVNHCFLSFH